MGTILILMERWALSKFNAYRKFGIQLNSKLRKDEKQINILKNRHISLKGHFSLLNP